MLKKMKTGSKSEITSPKELTTKVDRSKSGFPIVGIGASAGGLEANCVYVIPPNKDLSILHGVLHLLTPLAPRGLRLPIDFFFRSLAEDQQEHSIGVILSGMGSDGTLGLRTIKEKGGSVFVQEPSTAKFDGMPHSAIDAGLADVIAAINELPASISAFIHHAPLFTKPNLLDEDQAKSSIEKVRV